VTIAATETPCWFVVWCGKDPASLPNMQRSNMLGSKVQRSRAAALLQEKLKGGGGQHRSITFIINMSVSHIRLSPPAAIRRRNRTQPKH